MSLHPSLRRSTESGQHRSVLKRLERLVHFMKKDEWKEGGPVFALPKVKVLKFKIKKEKAKGPEKAAGVAAEGEALATGAAPAAEAHKPETPPAKEKK